MGEIGPLISEFEKAVSDAAWHRGRCFERTVPWTTMQQYEAECRDRRTLEARRALYSALEHESDTRGGSDDADR